MPRLTDPSLIRSLLETDRHWAVYALGDLSPGLFEDSEWYGRSEPSPALLMLYHGFGEPILFAMGEPGLVRGLLEEAGELISAFLHIPLHLLPVIEEQFRVMSHWPMWRMILRPERFTPESSEGVVRLGHEDLAAFRRLTTGGDRTGQSPPFFLPSMLDDGSYFGFYDGEDLVSVAGTHFVALSVGVGAVGNVFTRSDRRGKGLARRVASAVVEELLCRDLQTIALNVDHSNVPALHLYEKIGFACHCPFVEGHAIRRTLPTDEDMRP